MADYRDWGFMNEISALDRLCIPDMQICDTTKRNIAIFPVRSNFLQDFI